VLAARSQDKLDALAGELGGGDAAVSSPRTVTEWPDNEAAVQRALDAFGRLDVVFANAGFGAKRGWLEESPEQWRAMVLTNVLGRRTPSAPRSRAEETRGHVLLTGSIAGRRALPGSLYSATKFAVHAMGEAIRADLNDTGSARRSSPPAWSRRRSSTTSRASRPCSPRTSRRRSCTPPPSTRGWTSTRSS
jgi:NADP-dependent 3-hydroxy acid dehydrogenase YdfG